VPRALNFYGAAFSRTRKGGWAVAQSQILETSITLGRLGRRRYEVMTTLYTKDGHHFQNTTIFLID